MHQDHQPRRQWRVALLSAVAAAVALGLIAIMALGLALRQEVDRTGDPLARSADRLAARLDPGDVAEARGLLATTGADARLIGPGGRVRAQTGPGGAWRAGDAGWVGALATSGAGGWSLRDGAVEASRELPSGARVVLRQELPEGAGTLGSAAWVAGALVLVLGLAFGGLAWWLAGRRARTLRRLSSAAGAAAEGRPAALPAAEGDPEWRRLLEAVVALAARAGDMQAAAESRVEALAAAILPLAHPVAARTPAGGLVRNEALERLAGALAPADRAELEDALRAGLGSPGAVSRRLALSDGRALEVEAWSVPGGRLVAIGERTEQARLAALRRQVTGAAARHLQAPVSEIQALGSDLLGQVPAAAAPTVRRLLAAADRMERLVGQLLRGTANDPRARPPRVRVLGASGIAYALGRAFDQRLRDRGLRLETDIPSDLPPVRADPALAHEILSELIANSAAFTPRGGTITLSGRALPGGGVELAVSDTGPGIAGEELHLVAEPFARGAGAMGLPGSGLGLGVAAALAGRLGGRLTLEAGPGGRARLELPSATAPDDRVPEAPEPVSAGAAASP
jgi:signal transduction histidine kinase